MQNFVRNLLTEWRKLKLPFAGETFVAAISGGADSVSLLLALHDLKIRKKLNLRFVAAHFNHQLRGADSDKDEQFVKNLAVRLGFELSLGSGEIFRETGNVEQNARNARYQFLAETAGNLDACTVLTAHTLNDQAETFLFNLIRGSGLDGLGGMKPVRILNSKIRNPKSDETAGLEDKSSVRLVRPLLNWAKREDTENFCRLNEVEFRYDAMNEDLKFNRVRIRKILLPLLKDFNPKIIETLAKTAELLRDDASALGAARREMQNRFDENQTANDKKPNGDQSEHLLLKELKEFLPSIRRIVLRDWLKERRGDLRRLDAKHFEAVEKLAFSRRSGRMAELPDGEIIIKKDGKLVFQKAKVEKS